MKSTYVHTKLFTVIIMHWLIIIGLANRTSLYKFCLLVVFKFYITVNGAHSKVKYSATHLTGTRSENSCTIAISASA